MLFLRMERIILAEVWRKRKDTLTHWSNVTEIQILCGRTTEKLKMECGNFWIFQKLCLSLQRWKTVSKSHSRWMGWKNLETNLTKRSKTWKMANHGRCKNCWWGPFSGKIVADDGYGQCWMHNGSSHPYQEVNGCSYCPDYANRRRENRRMHQTLQDWIKEAQKKLQYWFFLRIFATENESSLTEILISPIPEIQW